VATVAILDLQLKPESVDTAHELIHATLSQTRAFPGCLGATVLVDTENPAHVVVYESWESIERDEAYREWRKTPEGASRLGTILASALKLTKYTIAEGV
jgi:heme oxygenase (mycobilin-producing)